MKAKTLQEQAEYLEQLLPRLMRRMFTLDPDHPAAEMPVAQLRVCTILQTGPRTLSAISEELGISVSATTQIADRMERAGLVERIASVDDRRTKYLQLTPHGRELMRTRRALRVRGVEMALAQLTLDQRHAIIQGIQTLLEASIATAPELPHTDPVGIRQEQG